MHLSHQVVKCQGIIRLQLPSEHHIILDLFCLLMPEPSYFMTHHSFWILTRENWLWVLSHQRLGPWSSWFYCRNFWVHQELGLLDLALFTVRASQVVFDFVEHFDVNVHSIYDLESWMNPICKGLLRLPLCVYLVKDLIWVNSLPTCFQFDPNASFRLPLNSIALLIEAILLPTDTRNLPIHLIFPREAFFKSKHQFWAMPPLEIKTLLLTLREGG